MPELPEVETTRRGLLKSLRNKTVIAVSVHTKKLRLPIPRDLNGSTDIKVMHIARRAKYMIWELSNGRHLLIHLGMSGRFRHVADKNFQREKHDHVVFHLSDNTVLAYHDPRRFGLIDWAVDKNNRPHPWLANIGVEPLSNALNAAWLFTQLNKRKLNMKAALLDQKMIAGLGNIYVVEALFLSGIRPTRLATRVTHNECKKLVPAIKKVLRAAIDAGGSSLRDYRDIDGQIGFFQDQFNVYDRAEKACRKCKTGIKHLVQSGRSSYYCPQCQC
jgi:formamidopyrimidine-DNA glycosylase